MIIFDLRFHIICALLWWGVIEAALAVVEFLTV